MFAIFAMLILVNAATANINVATGFFKFEICFNDIIAMAIVYAGSVNNGFYNVSVFHAVKIKSDYFVDTA